MKSRHLRKTALIFAFVLTSLLPAGNTLATIPCHEMVGGETQHVLIIHDLDPGDYTAAITFDKGGVEMNVTIQVDESSGTPEAATPEA